MLSLPSSASYAILAARCLVRCEAEWHKAQDIATCTSIPPEYLRKILTRMEQAGLLASKRGYKGGFRMARDPAKVSLFDLIAAVEPSSLEPRCFLGLGRCSELHACVAHEFHLEVQEKIEGYLKRTTLADVSEFEWPAEILGNLDDLRLVEIGRKGPSV